MANPPDKTTPILSGLRDAPFLSQLTYWWFNKLMYIGYEKTLTPLDLFELDAQDEASSIAKRFDSNWTIEATTAASRSSQPNVLRTLIRTFGVHFAVGVLLHLCITLLQFANPQLLKHFIGFIAHSEQSIWYGFSLAALFFVVCTGKSFIKTYLDHVMHQIGMNLRSSLISAIYRKSLTLSNSSRSKITTGEIVNLMGSDASHLSNMMPFVNTIWSGPLQIILTMYFLYIELGVAFLAGLAVMVLFIPFNSTIANRERKHLSVQMEAQDERVKAINEVLNSIRIIKFNGWEIPYIRQINEIRDREVVELRKVGYLTAMQCLLWSASPFLVSMVTFSIYVLSSEHNILDPQKAFISLVLFEMLKTPLTRISWVFADLLSATLAVKRLNHFLNSSQLENYVTRDESSNTAVEIQNGSFAWGNNGKEEEETKLILNEINLKFNKGKLVAIVGNVGSGKSSLLSAILGDMEKVDGSVNVAKGETIAYVSQQAWIQNATVRDNVLFGSQLDESKYESIIEMCALNPDLAILPGGDLTEIGEKGINLSGGQKQRVAIARACYADASIVLLDDPLSAVDSHVSRHIFRHVLSSTSGYLRNRTRILVTNQISLLPEVDQIIVLSNGRISQVGTYQQLIGKSGQLSEFIREHSHEKAEDSEPILEQETSKPKEKPKSSTKPSNETSKLIKIEQSATGHVKLSVFLNYFRSLTWICVLTVMFGYFGSEVCSVGSNVWLALWSNSHSLDHSEKLRNVGIYCLFGLGHTFLMFIATFAVATGNVKSSVSLHRTLLDRIMRSPMHFFDTTPIGRIVTRFSSDMNIIDCRLPYNFDGWITGFVQMVSFLLFITFKIPLYILAIIPMSWMYYFIQKFYIVTSRQLKRLEMTTKSPISSHFTETLQGVSTIRAFGSSHRFVQESNARLDNCQRCCYSAFIADRWLSLWLEFCGNLIVLSAVILAVISRQTFRLEPGFVGLIVAYTLPLTETLNFLVRTNSAIQKNIVSVERVIEFCENETEGEWTRQVNENPTLPDNWPEKGEIEFVDYSLRYREGLELVLHGINFKVKGGEKVGIVGRTGAGKSSLTLALFRIVESAGGKIKIDGVDIDRIGLHELRDKLSIIPQDPVLFSGTIRSNLDPFGVYRNELLNSVLDQCHLSTFINSLQSGLDYAVSENGSNLSVGQRQLICLSRALLRRTPILVLDEATAAIDLQTDALIQQTIRQQFANCTVLTIAHRLNTILDSDRVLVLDQGKVAEFDTPTNLLANTNSKFYSLARDAKIV